MAVKTRNILGIELDDQQVRICEIRMKPDECVVTQVTTLTPESGYISETGFVEPDRLGIQIRAALQWAEISGRDAVFGLPAWMCTVRPLSIPPVPEQELHLIVEGEIEHAQFFRQPGASFDLIRIHDSKLTEPSGHNILIMGAERKILDGVREIAQSAGLKLLAVEPTQTALYRAAHTQSTDPSVIVTLSETHAQISLLDRGNLALHRAFDLGGSIFEVPEGGAPDQPMLELDAASNLAVELRRSIDYYTREMFDAPRPQAISLACAHANAPILAQWLSAALRMQVDVTDLRHVPPPMKVGRPLSDSDSMRYVGAFGLAYRDRELVPENVPVADLFANEHARIAMQDDRRRKFRVAMVASFVLLGCSALLATFGTIRAKQAAADLAASQKKLSDQQAIAKVQADEVAKRATRLRVLTEQGVPTRSLIQAIARTMPNNVGLVEVRMNPTSTEISGETTSEAAIIQMSDALRADPRFLSVSLSWFERINPSVPELGERFRMTVQTVPPSPTLASPQPTAMNGSPTPGGRS